MRESACLAAGRESAAPRQRKRAFRRREERREKRKGAFPAVPETESAPAAGGGCSCLPRVQGRRIAAYDAARRMRNIPSFTLHIRAPTTGGRGNVLIRPRCARPPSPEGKARGARNDILCGCAAEDDVFRLWRNMISRCAGCYPPAADEKHVPLSHSSPESAEHPHTRSRLQPSPSGKVDRGV